MSIVFSIKNKKSLFGYQKVLAAQEVLKLVEGLTTYNYDPATLHRPLNDFEGLNCIVLVRAVFLCSYAILMKKSLIKFSCPLLR